MTTIVLPLPPDIEAQLNQQASREGKSVEQIAIDGLRHYVASQPPPTSPPQGLTADEFTALGNLVRQPESPPQNLLEFLGDFVGCIEGNGEANSENTGQRFADYLVQKKQAGKL